ncbi:MAG TPA: hypothetical protein VGC44_00435 [Longimicrobiales bacterium]
MVTAALAKTESLFFQLHVLEAFIARRESIGELAEDDEIIGDVAQELLAHQSVDGSWGGSLAVTAEALLLLSDLHVPARFVASVARATQWLRRRRKADGRFTEGCSPERHEQGICEHFAGGFFSPGPPSRDFGGTRLANGLTFQTDADARLGLSCLALHAVRRWSKPTPDDLIHLDALARIANLALKNGSPAVATSPLITVLSALTSAPRRGGFIHSLHGALTRLARIQRADGSWPAADPFHVADIFLLAVHSGYGSPVFDAALTRTAQLFVLTQHPDGSWGPDGGPARLLTGWRTLRYAMRLENS